ncbi:unnamed protein product [Hydatigera taeniaeformis]|uniref:VWFA domain-containing protein n=1 Tax=Hydatigena taeniaeformis TaxID=6205 RepID=A0A158RDF8_HYDTA|nr:unnamed protein product [Hydatigera taeniaeformis]
MAQPLLVRLSTLLVIILVITAKASDSFTISETAVGTEDGSSDELQGLTQIDEVKMLCLFCSDDCPRTVMSDVCQNNTLIRVTKRYLKDARGNCVKVVDRHKLPGPVCPPPALLKASPCSPEGRMTEFYKTYRIVNCKCEKVIESQQKTCPCKPCETTRSVCDPHTKTVEVITVCYRHANNGLCEPVRQTDHEPCGGKHRRLCHLKSPLRNASSLFKFIEILATKCSLTATMRLDCSNGVTRRELPCDYCKGRRDVVVVTQFREESSPKRCLVLEKRITEPCVGLNHCDLIAGCRGQALVRLPCKRDPTTGIGMQEIRLISEHPVNCTCTRSVHTIKQVCSCPPGVKRETVCHSHSNTMIVKSIRYRLDRKDGNHATCRAMVRLKHLPPPPCPPLNETTTDNRSMETKEVCDPATCQRHFVTSGWQLEGCECRRTVRKEAAGKCCCPKPDVKVSPCVGNQRSVQKNTYILVNGQCLHHVTNKIEPCRNDLQDLHRVYCDEALGAKVYETSTFRQLAEGTLETLQRRTIPVVCNDTYVQSAGACTRDSATGRMIRTAVVMSSSLEGCECTTPRAHILTTACDCVDVETGEAKQEGESFREEVPCDTYCTPGGELCGTPACQRKTRWYSMIHLGEGNPPRCRKELINEVIADCCCPPDSKITRTCSLDGGAKWQMAQTKYRLEGGRCTPHETRWQEVVNCSEGLVDQERGPRRPDGLQEVRLVFETLVGCKCVRAEKQLQCPWRCPEPTRRVYCDNVLDGESVVEVTRFNLLGCKCQRQVERTRSKISCPPDRRGKAICNPATNELEETITRFLLIGGKCREIVETERRPVRCSEDLLATDRTVKQPLLRCDKQTGEGTIVRPVWRVNPLHPLLTHTHKCDITCHLIPSTECNDPRTVTVCDPDRGVRVHQVTKFTLNAETLQCVPNTTVEEEPLSCPKPETIYTPCDPLSGKRKVIVVSYVEENCMCKRREEELSVSCRCGADKPSFTKSVCNVLLREISMEGTLKEWRDDLNQCVDVVKRITHPHICNPRVKFVQSSCKKGKMELKKIVQEPDPNDCKCVTNVTISRVDCRCPPRTTMIGSCDSGEERQALVYLERDWDPQTKQCIYKNRHQEDLVCGCPTASESTTCVKGLMERRRTRFEVYMGRLGCKREEEVQRWQPNCSVDVTREEFGECDLTTCQRSLTVYGQTYNSSTCQCDWLIKAKKQCSCCGCPEPIVSSVCHNNTEWITRSDHYVPHLQGCGHVCRKHSIVSRQPIRCNQEPEEGDKCHEGTLLHVLKTVSLVDHHCKESVKYITKQIECDQPNERKVGVCDPLTCKRSLYETTYTRDRKSCECLPEQKLIGNEDCCCLPPPKPTKTCVGECYVSIKTLAHFDETQKTCVRTESASRQCPACPLPSEVVKPCGSAGDCLQIVTRTEYYLDDCRCKPREVVTTRKCCCQQPSREGQEEEEEDAGICLPEEHVLLHRRAVYDLVDGECVKRIKEHRTPVECPPRGGNESRPVVELGDCDKTSCLRKVRQSKWVLTGCRCHRITNESTEACCCNQFQPQVKEICRPDGTILKETKYWKVSNGNCKPEVLSKVLQKVECPPIRIQPTGPCETSTGRQPIKLIKNEFKNCKCEAVAETTKDRLCRCKEPEQAYSRCNTITCLQNVTETQYKLEGGACKAQPPMRKVKTCCCTPQELQLRVSRECNPKTGSISETTVKHVYDGEKGECRTVKTVRTLPPKVDAFDAVESELHALKYLWFNETLTVDSLLLECPKKPLVKRGRCNIASGVAIDIVARSLFDTKSCTCKRSVAPVQRICDCSHLPTIPPETHCDDQNAELVTTEIKFVLKNNACVNKTESYRKKIVCPPAKETFGPCDQKTCLTVVETTRHVLEGCRCVNRQSRHQETCCCPKPRITEACLENGSLLVQRHINYTFNPEKKSCETAIRVVQMPIDCGVNRSVEISRHCDTTTCRLTSLVEVNTPQNCKCAPKRLTVVDNDRYCCCPPPKETSSCENDRGLVAKINVFYTLENGTCIPKMMKLEEKIRCPEPEVVLGLCSQETRVQEVTNVSYVLQNCRCKKRVKRSTQTCGCPSSEITLSPCGKESQIRNVSRISYLPVNGTCVKRVEVLRSEPCRCPPSRTTRHCDKGSWIRRNYTYRLTERNGRTDCIKEIDTEKTLVTCPAAQQLTIGECNAELQQRNVSFQHFSVDPTTCECVPNVTIRSEACDCHRKNKKVVVCKGNELIIDNYEYSSHPGDQKCSLKTSHEVKTITCPANRQVVEQSEGCVIKRANGTYRAEVTRWQELEQCKCVPREEVIEKLCNCPEPEETSRCVENSLLVTERLRFTRQAEQCVAKREVMRRKIGCKSETQIIGVSSCTKSTNESGKCYETVTLERHYAENCKCLKKSLALRRLCCSPPGKTNRRCDAKRHQWRSTVTKYAVVPGDVLFSDGNVTILDNKLATLNYETIDTIVCPATKVHEDCDKEKGVWTQTTTWHEFDGCACKRREVVKTGKCVCPKREVWESPCEKHFRTVRIKSYKLVNGECLPYVASTQERCSCPGSSVQRVRCDGNGLLIKCTLTYTFEAASKRCKARKLCVSWAQTCPSSKRYSVGTCGPETGYRQRISQVNYTLDRATCKCKPRIINKWDAYCDCAHLNTQNISCDNGVRTTSVTTYKLIDGECMPDEVSKFEKIGEQAPTCRLRCRPPRVERRCVDNGTSLVEKRTRYVLTTDGLTSVCTEQQTERPISACSLKGGSKTWTVREHCDPSTCQRMVHTYKRTSQGMTHTEVCCCPKSTPVNTTCLARAHVLEKRFISYTLLSSVTINGKQHSIEPYCAKVEHKIQLPVTCKEKEPRILMGDCQAGENQTVEVIGSYPLGCQCKDHKIRRLSFRCGCPKFLKRIFGRCVNAQQVEKVVTLQAVPYTKTINGRRVNSTRCRPVVVSRRVLPCACTAKPQALSKCLSGNTLQIEETKVYFNETSRVCQKETIESASPTICPSPEKTTTKCGGEESGFTATEIVTVWTPLDCECVPKTTERQFVCNCTAKHPPHSRRTCKMDHILETTVTSSRLKGHQCVPHIIKSTTHITCPAELRSEKSPSCNETTRQRQIVWFKQVPVNCKCEWRPIISTDELRVRGLPSFEWCSCPDPIEVDSKCRPTGSNQYLHQRTLVKYRRQGGDCTPVRETLYSNFSCLEGTQIHRSACDHLTGFSIERRVTMRVEDCACKVVAESTRRCACACTSTPFVRTTCRPESGLLETTEEFLELVDCECLRRVRRTSRIVECSGTDSITSQRHEGACVVDQVSGNSYRNVTWTTTDREGCRCVKRRHRARELCACDPRERNFTRCVDNVRMEIRTIRRVLIDEKQCVEKEISKAVFAVSCPEAQVLTSVCDNATGLATVSKLQPVVEKCQCKTQLQHYKVPCKCKALEKVVHKSPCNKTTCLSTVTYAYEVPDATANGGCITKKAVKEVKCCCPPSQKEHFCEPSSGMSGTRVREFHLLNGQCVPVMRITSEQPLICPHNETTITKTLKSGKIRFLRKTTVREGCRCRNKSEIVYSQWECPKSTRNKTCVKLNGTNQFAWLTTVSNWRLSSDEVPTCKHHEVRTDVSPVICPPPNITQSICFFVEALHGFVRNVTIHNVRAVDCECVLDEPKIKVEICNCSQPVVNFAFAETEGIVTKTIIQFNATSDKSRCVPHEIQTKWSLICFPTKPVLRITTACKSGRFYKIYTKRAREGSTCRTLVKRVSRLCNCPKPVTTQRCLSDGITKIITTIRYTRHRLGGPCEREERAVKVITSCDKLSEDELRAGRDYTIRPTAGNSTHSVLHVYPCGTGGSACTRHVVQVTIARALDGCRCVVRRKEGSEACCCNAEGVLGSNEKPMKTQWVDCESMGYPISVRQQKTWHLMDGKCWPLTFTSSKPLICSNKEVVRPVGTCINGTQRFLVIKSVQSDCRCKTVKSIESRPCCELLLHILLSLQNNYVLCIVLIPKILPQMSLVAYLLYSIQSSMLSIFLPVCQTVSAAEVIFMVDESVSSRDSDYSRRVRDILHLTIHTFKDTRNGTLEAFRFAVVKYSSNPSIAFNLGQYGESAPMLSHVERINYEGRLSNINKALTLVKTEVLPRVRTGVTTMVYIISDGVNDESAGASQIASELTAAGIQIFALAVGVDARGHAFLRNLTSKPRSRHFMIYTLEEKADVLSNWLINSLCIQACPESTQTRSPCSRETGCLGHIFEHSYRFSADLGKCIGTSTKRPYRCCCLETPREVRQCVNGSLILTKELWKLSNSKNGLSVCQHFKIEQDVTGQLLRECPSEEIQRGICTSDGVRTEVTIRRKVEDCECKVIREETTKRCICDSKARKEERCIGGNVALLTIREEVLNADGYCEEKETVVNRTISCSEPKMVVGACDPLTCKRRVVYVREQPEECKCKELVKTLFEPCCKLFHFFIELVYRQISCPEAVPISHLAIKDELTIGAILHFPEGCLAPKLGAKGDDCLNGSTKVTIETSVHFSERKRACVTKTERTYEPVECPKGPVFIESECVHIGNDTDVETDSATRPDPNLLYRRVEVASWDLTDCRCLASRRWEFETCGCRQAENPEVHECHDKEGILISYYQSYQLSVSGINETYVGSEAVGRRFNQLKQASCVPVLSDRKVLQTVCPDDVVSYGPCVYKDDGDGRAFRRVTTQMWQREGCKCKQLPVNVTKELCGCRRKVWIQKRCSSEPKDKEAVLLINVLRERLLQTPRGPRCKVDVQRRKQLIKCPPSSVYYSNCSNGQMTVTTDMVNIEACKCKTKRLIRYLRCLEIAMDGESMASLGTGELSKNLSFSTEVNKDFEQLRQRLSDLGLSDIKTPAGVEEEEGREQFEGYSQPLNETKKGRDLGKPFPVKEAHYPSQSLGLKEVGNVSERRQALEPVYFGYTGEPLVTKSYPIPQTPTKPKSEMLKLLIPVSHEVGKPPVSKYMKTVEPPFYGHTTQARSKEASESPRISIGSESIPEVLPKSKKKEKKHEGKPPKQNVINFIECADLLPVEKCIEMDQGPNSHCDKPGQIRDKLCRKTCHLCQVIVVHNHFGINFITLFVEIDFPINRTDFSIEGTELNDCLVTDRRYDRRYHLTTLKGAGLSRCKNVCNNDPRCLGFDFYVPINEAVQGSCVLSTVDRPTLKRRLNLKKVETGANAEDLNRMDAKLCIRFQRVRRPRELEPTLNYLVNCTCENMSSENALAFTIASSEGSSSEGQLHCVKDVEISALNWSGQVTCQPPEMPTHLGGSRLGNATTDAARKSSRTGSCLDVKPTQWCEEVARTAACKKPAFRAVCSLLTRGRASVAPSHPSPIIRECGSVETTMRVCGGTCGVCVCNRSYEYFGRCLPNGRMTVVKVENTYSFLHGRCVSVKHVRVLPCEVCPAQPYELVHSCDPKTETRMIIRVIPLFNSSNSKKCQLKFTKQALSCKGCMFEGAHSIERNSVSPCKRLPNGTHRLVLRTEYVVSEDGCCKIRKSLRSFPCVGCPKPRVSLSKCLGGWQLKITTFFTRPTTGKFSDENKGIPASACFRHADAPTYWVRRNAKRSKTVTSA